MRMSRFAWIPLLSAVAGCAIGNTHTFNYRPQETSELGRGTTVLVFAVKDARPYIVAGEEPASFVGEQRAGYGGVLHNVLTTDGRPFAEHVAETVGRDLQAAGFKVLASDRVAEGDIGRFLAEQGADRAMAVVMREFNSNTYNNIDVEWDFEAAVYGADGKELHRRTETGKTTLTVLLGGFGRVPGQPVPTFFYELIHKLVAGDPEVIRALKAR
jgi:hypothetical protein